jgi:hypothetical protein
MLSAANRLFAGAYPGGSLLEWTPLKPWVPTSPGDPVSNPVQLAKVTPVIHRPHALLAINNGQFVLMGGTPEYGYTGGGLLLYNREAHQQDLLQDTELIPDQSTMSMAPLPDGTVLCGTTTTPGTGGEKKAKEAELYIFDPITDDVVWHAPLIPGAQEYTALFAADGDKIYGVADHHILFEFDPAAQNLLLQQDLLPTLGTTVGQQGPRVFVQGDDQRVFLMLAKGIAELKVKDNSVHGLASSPKPIEAGGDYLDGKIYFACGSHICSYTLPKAAGSVVSH